MIKRFTLVTFLLFISFSIFAQSKDWKSVERDGYSIDFPQDWIYDESGFSGTVFIVMSPVDSETDGFNENINLLVQDLSGYDLDLDAFVNLSINQIKTLMNESEIIESTRVTNSAYNYHKVIYTAREGDIDVQFIQHYWVIKNEAYVLTFTSEEIKFEKYKAVAEKILNSFKVKQ